MKNKDFIFSYGREFLSKKPFQTAELSSKECKFYHMEQVPDTIADTINKNGYYIIEMKNCQ
ncbi:DUF2024 family protein [Arenibacter sp. F26102]|nr:DUF2024 family protein [Arenibacter sp. F26102]